MNKIWFPWQRAIRTALAVIAGAIVSTAAALGVISAVAPQILDAVKDLLRPEDYLMLVSWLAGVAAVSAAVSRVMAIPQVDEWLRKFGAGSAPAGAQVYTNIDGHTVGMTRRQWRAMVDGADTGTDESEGLGAATSADTDRI